MRRIAIALGVALILALTPPPVAAQTSCRFVLGFATLRDLVGAQKVGNCLENERFNPSNGNAEQRTTGGLLVWRKVDNFTAFTDGGTTWVNGPNGLQRRANTERFAWELDPVAGAPRAAAPSAAPAPAPAAPPRESLSSQCGALALELTSNVPRSRTERLTGVWGDDDVTAATRDQCMQAASRHGQKGVDCFASAYRIARGSERSFPGQGASAYQGAYDRCIAGR